MRMREAPPTRERRGRDACPDEWPRQRLCGPKVCLELGERVHAKGMCVERRRTCRSPRTASVNSSGAAMLTGETRAIMATRGDTAGEKAA